MAAVVERLRATFNTGRTKSIAWRIEQLKALRALVKDNADTFVDALQSDVGRPLYEAWTGDVYCAQAQLSTAIKDVKKWAKPRRLKKDITFFPSKVWLQPEPLGIVLVLGPWNYPLELATNPAVGAIAAGNCVIIKPSATAPETSNLLINLAPHYLDEDAVAVVRGGVPAATELLEQDVDYIFYTGSGEIGRTVYEAAVRNLTPVTLELGGKCPAIFTNSANLKVACNRLVWGKWLNCGQTCTAPDYVLVEKSVEAAFLKQMQQTIRRFYGEDPQKSSSYGRIVNLKHFKRLSGYLDGQEIVAGGQTDESDLYIAPTILRNVSSDSAIMEAEIFGPLLPVISVPNVDAAIEFINARPKPLAISIFGEDKAVHREILERTTAGGVDINHCHAHSGSAQIPFGGVGESGMGRYHGKWGFDSFSNLKPVVSSGTWTQIMSKIMHPPYTERKLRFLKKLAMWV